MTTIQIDERTHEKLFKLMTSLQNSLGRKVNFNDAVNYLLAEHETRLYGTKRLLDLFGTLDITRADEDLRSLRKEEERRLAEIT